jgi:UDP-N-acetylmuramoylalanine--D-glutamate ligase
VHNFKNKKVLVFGLGLLGGGVATTNWLLEQGAKVTVTDSKNSLELAASLRNIKGKPKLALGRYDEEDIKNSEIVVFNPAVSVFSPPVMLAKKLGKQIENEATIFYANCTAPIVAVTGTRGKTTTANWLKHLLGGRAVLAGNSYHDPLLKALPVINRKKNAVVVNEIPSFHLEYFNSSLRAPGVAVITNLYEDHLNRHRTMENYADTKANIFVSQSKDDHLVLNADNVWTKYFVFKKPASHIWYFSTSRLSREQDGLFWQGSEVRFQQKGVSSVVGRFASFKENRGEHNAANFLAAVLAAYLAGATWEEILRRVSDLPEVEFRQQLIHSSPRLSVVNDTTATSPEGAIAAVERFGGKNCVLIAGGTDCEFDYKEWASVIDKKILPDNLFLLVGTATEKMQKALPRKFFNLHPHSLSSDCFAAALNRAKQIEPSVLLLSPGAKSFGLFLNEYDRGRKFNAFIKKSLG